MRIGSLPVVSIGAAVFAALLVAVATAGRPDLVIYCAHDSIHADSIIRGFAIMLGIGILISMFTAITVTRAFLKTLDGTRAVKNESILGVKLPKAK